MKRCVRSWLMGVTLVLTAGHTAKAQSVPVVDLSMQPNQPALFEAGLFLGGGYLPDYPGSDENRWRYLPIPYIFYRGTILRADENEGMRARMILASRVHLEVSVSGSFPVDSKHNTARQGMPDLDWLGEIGPRLTVSITDPKAPTRLKLMVPFRAVFSTDFQYLAHRGFNLSPGLLLESFDFIRPHWRGIAFLSPAFTNRQMNAYFYDVTPAFARADRPFYDARAGYIGTDLILDLMVPFLKRCRFFAGTRFSTREGSANSASPLFKSRTEYAVFSGIAYSFYRSLRTGQR